MTRKSLKYTSSWCIYITKAEVMVRLLPLQQLQVTLEAQGRGFWFLLTCFTYIDEKVSILLLRLATLFIQYSKVP